ncbi:MAG: M48 family metallopeptidase [Blastocatellia bacterium]|nr:M48 family metallopeptidase [Blastocatellia bacterium]
MKKIRNLISKAGVIAMIALLVLPLGALAQTRVKAPKNPYDTRKDVELGQQAAAEVERQLPVMNDAVVSDYVERVGRRLVESIPGEFQHREFRYSFKVVNASDINAFALPGGFTYVNRGLIEAASNEGEMAGVMAHEISHVALRHGTAQAAKAQKYAIGQAAGAILGAIIGGGVGGVIAQGSQFGIGAYFLKFSREYEKQADLLGAQMMADAGYDPRDLANMFRTIERASGGGGPQWLSSHPNPGNRYEYINKEADLLRVNDPIHTTRDFNRIRARLRDMPRARSMSEIGQSNQRHPTSNRQPAGRVEYPSSRYRTYTGGNLFQLNVPSNWRELRGDNEVTFAPEGAYGEVQRRFVFTHGAQVGVTRARSRDLRQATDYYLRELAGGNPNLRQQGGYQRGNIAGQYALGTTLTNISDVTGRTEIVLLYTTFLRNGDLLYMIGVAPQNEYRNYQRTFQNILSSIRLNN